MNSISTLRIFKSKKGGIPLVNEIVQLMIKIVPAPIWLLTFLFLMTTISGFLMPQILQLFGYDCASNKGVVELYQVPPSALFQNAFTNLVQSVSKTDAVSLLTDYKIPDDPFPNGDKTYLRIPDECFVTIQNASQTITGYTALTTNCSYVGVFYSINNISNLQSVLRTENSICTSDGYGGVSLSWVDLLNQWKKHYVRRCEPPIPYYFNYTNCYTKSECYFTITDTSLISSVNTEFISDVYLQRVLSLGGTKRSLDTKNEMTNVQCKAEGQPTIYFFTIEMFNQQMWMLLIAGYFLITFAFIWFKMVRI
jgi:hypothetical protein